MKSERFLHSQELLNDRGVIEVITGPMFCGKSDELIRRLRRRRVAIESMQQSGILEDIAIERRIRVFKPSIDNRRGDETINTEDGDSFPAIKLDRAADCLGYIDEDTLVVAFDEAQFWEEKDLENTCGKLSDENRVKVIVAGLSLDFRGEKWGAVGNLALTADKTDVLTAICTKCGNPAPLSQRIIEETTNGEKTRRPANYNDPIKVVGGTNLYEARCRLHHEIPGKPENK